MSPRKPLDEQAKKFLKGDEPTEAQTVEQTKTKKPAQKKTKGSSLLDEILPDKDKEDTTRFCVDLPNSLAKKLSKVAQQKGVPKTEIVRRLIAKALED